MTDPVPARATGSFDERTPSPSLRPGFAAVWVHRMDPAGALPIVIMPDATVDLEWIGGRFRIAGPDRDPKTEILASNDVVVGFRFRPAAAAAWFGVPLTELVGQRLPLDDLWGRRACGLAGRVRVGDAGLVSALEDAIAGEIFPREPDRPMQAAYRLVERGRRPDRCSCHG